MKALRNVAFLVMVMVFAAAPAASMEASQSCDYQFYSDGYDVYCNTFPFDCECPVDFESECVTWCNTRDPALFYQGSGCSQNTYICDMWCACVPWP